MCSCLAWRRLQASRWPGDLVVTSRRASAVLIAPLLILLAACSGGQSSATPKAQPGQTPPPGFAVQRIGLLSFAVPQAWQPVSTQPGRVTGGIQELALRAPGPKDEPAPVALALISADPQRPAAKEVMALVTIKRDVQRAQQVREQALALPGFASATLVSYDEPNTSGGPLHTEVLVGELADGSVVTLTIKAEQGEFAAANLGAIALSATADGTRAPP